MSILEDVAKIIDPSAFDGTEWRELVDGEYRTHERMATRQRLAQATAKAKAQEILQCLGKRPDFRAEAVAAEVDGWADLGIPVRGNPDAEKVVRGKYGLA